MSSIAIKDIQKIAAYFNACYQADNRDHNLWDLFADKNEFLNIASPQQMDDLSRQSHCVLDGNYAQSLEKNVVIYRREKVLLFCQYFLTTQTQLKSGLRRKPVKLCAPLVFHEAEIRPSNQGFEIAIDQTTFRWNTSLLNLLSDDNEIESRLQQSLGDSGVVDIESVIRTLQEGLKGEVRITLGPQIESVEALLEAKNRSEADNISLSQGGGFVLTSRSTSSRGIIDELNTMSRMEKHSQALLSLLERSQNPHWLSNPYNVDNIPGLLSSAQQKAVKNAAQKSLSVLIGPPGTGKSYTIACIILERFLQGESVLLVTQNESAVDVIHNKLTEHLGVSSKSIVRSGNKEYHRDLKRKLANILGGSYKSKDNLNYKNLLKRILKKIHKSEARFVDEAKRAVTDGLFLTDMMNGEISNHWFNRFKRWLTLNLINKQTRLFDQLEAIHKAHDKRKDILAKHINSCYLGFLLMFLLNNRKQLQSFSSALKARTSRDQEVRFLNIDYDQLLKALPIWLSSLSALHKSLPMKEDLFDLVIIDEATQCNMASCLPALHRAKRVMVVGDPKQLRHLSFLSAKKQQHLLSKHQLLNSGIDLNYRDHSMIDLASAMVPTQDDMVFLDEHYRSMPEIIRFSNKKFYNNHLRIMTAKPRSSKKLAVRITHIEYGNRNNGVNEAEIEALFVKLAKILSFQNHLPEEHIQSIGILSFFREQADAIQKRLVDNFDLETLMKHKIRASTPYGFQGEERDIMLISCAVDPDTSMGTYHYLNRPDVFNVAITRARDLQYVFVSARSQQMPRTSLLREYLEHINHSSSNKEMASEKTGVHLKELCEELHKAGLETIHGFIVAGIPMDLMVVYKDQVLAIDLIGFPGELADVFHIERYHIFSRADLTLFPLSLGSWLVFRDKIIETIKNTLEHMHQRSLAKINISQRANLWKTINTIDSTLAEELKETEQRLISVQGFEFLKQLKTVTNCYRELNYLLFEFLNPGELTFIRYHESIKMVYETSLKQFNQLTQEQGDPESVDSKEVVQTIQKAIDKFHQTKIHFQTLIHSQKQNEREDSDPFDELDEFNRSTQAFHDSDKM